MAMTPQQICEALKIDYSLILNIYPYGSKVYGTATEESDDDFIIVYKSSLLPSGAFKDNAISSEDRKIQGTCYSRGGFLDAINNYQISALECLSLSEDKIVQEKMKFSLKKFDKKEFVKHIISESSAAWYRAKQSAQDDNIEFAKKNAFHALRILNFGIQIKKHQKIINYGSMNHVKAEIYNDTEFKLKKYNGEFMRLSQHMKY